MSNLRLKIDMHKLKERGHVVSEDLETHITNECSHPRCVTFMRVSSEYYMLRTDGVRKLKNLKDLEDRFKEHPANTEEIANAHELVRHDCRNLAEMLEMLLPPGREKSLAATKLEEVMFWANAAIDRHGLNKEQSGEK